MPMTAQHEENKNSGDEDDEEPEESSNRESENREDDKIDDRLQEKGWSHLMTSKQAKFVERFWI